MNAKIWLATLGSAGLGAYVITAATPVASGQHVTLTRDYLEACETGEGECHPVIIKRAKGERVRVSFPAFPRASVSLWDSLRYQRMMARQPVKRLEQKDSGKDTDKPNPITFDLTGRADGTYYLWLTSCGVGGTYEVRLKTQ